uniref:Peptidase S54 rhomboid domain-containing protein n=1 Tax=Mola mola TaxID=94237 RepID=A0A3Q3WX58_MOLML
MYSLLSSSDVFLYAFSHDELPSLLLSVAVLLSAGRFQERRWGTVAFLSLSALTVAAVPLLYTLLLFVASGEATRVCGYSGVQLALLTAQCRQVKQRRLLRFLPVWSLPWLLLLTGLLLLPGTPALFHVCSICLLRLPTYTTTQRQDLIFPLTSCMTVTDYIKSNFICCHRSTSLPQRKPVVQAAAASVYTQHPWVDTVPAWIMADCTEQSEADVLEQQMLNAGILASLEDAPENSDAKVEVPKSSVSSLRLQQLEKMGFPTEKAVVALAASKQLDGAISLLIDDRVGEQAVVVSKGKSSVQPHST